jgi:hypothetical protein
MKQLHLIGSAFALTVALAACSTSRLPGGTPASGPLSSQDAMIARDTISSEFALSAAALTVGNAVHELSFGSVSVQASGAGLTTQRDGGMNPGKPGDKREGKACVTISPDPVTDADKDGVPDTATYTYDCSRLGKDGAVVSSRKGTVEVSDPSSDAGVWGFDSKVNLVSTSIKKGGSRTITETRTGERHPRKTADKITPDETLNVNRSVTGETDAVTSKTWKLEFSATTPGSIEMGKPLPAGSISAQGSHSVTKDDKIRAYTLETTALLQYDPSCDDDLKIVAGTVKATVTKDTGTGTLEVTFGACGTEPVVVKTGEPAPGAPAK